MNILTINTAFDQTYVAVSSNGKVVSKCMDSSLKQSENVLGVVDECLQTTGLTIANLDCIGCVIGPGSFTGIRIGGSLVKGFCMAFPNIKKVQINSLDLIAYSFVSNNIVNQNFFVALNGLSGNIFACEYDKCANRVSQPRLLFGDELEVLKGTIVGLKQEGLDICNTYEEFSCQQLLNFTICKIEKNEYSEDFEPLYLRKSQAEVELEKKSKNN